MMELTDILDLTQESISLKDLMLTLKNTQVLPPESCEAHLQARPGGGRYLGNQ